ncbi:MAG: electron transfer flavoprotein subunit alpha/FixB family protein [candidate division WOR-3 bacterium]
MKALVFVETLKGVVREASLETINFAKILADEVIGVVVGKGVEVKGLNKLYVYEDERLLIPISKPVAEIIKEVQKKENAKFIVLPATGFGKELGGRLAAAFDAPILDDFMAYENGYFVKGFYSNKVFAHIRIDGNPVILSVRPRAFKPVEDGISPEVIKVNINLPEEYFSAKPVEIHEKSSEEVDVTEADIVVSGGRGMGSPENYHKWIIALRDAVAKATGLKVANGASRAVVDAGWVDHSHQVGQTGKTVSPLVYFAIGISGAIQHQAGMRTSKNIIAINKDPEAPIFTISDYGIVSKWEDVLPELVEKLNKIAEEKV